MKVFFFLICASTLILALDESQELTTLHPLQDPVQSNKLLCKMQSDITTYLYETPLSSYDFFNKNSSKHQSKPLITWIHGDVYINTLAVKVEPHRYTVLKDEQNVHLGDYRYDIFTLLNDLLLKMQDESDFSGSKERAILSTLIDGYFDKIKNTQMQCLCIDDALNKVKKYDILSQYTTVIKKQRLLNFKLDTLSKADTYTDQMLTKKMKQYASQYPQSSLLNIKSIAIDHYGNYILLCEGNSKAIQDDIILTLTAQTLPASYQIDTKMKKRYSNSSLNNKLHAVSSFNQNSYTGMIKINNRDFFVSKLNPSLKLSPQSEKTRYYKNYASALGFVLASFHANAGLEVGQSFAKQVNSEVKIRQLKIEMIDLVYSYNQHLEEKWGNFSDEDLSACKDKFLSDSR